MLHLIRCRMVQILREKSLMFWGLGFPIILATLFYAAFGNLGTESFADIPAAVVTVSENTAFSEYLQELDGSLLSLASMESSEAVQALEEETHEDRRENHLDPRRPLTTRSAASGRTSSAS